MVVTDSNYFVLDRYSVISFCMVRNGNDGNGGGIK